MSFQRNAGAVRLFARMMKFAAWLQNLPNKVTPPPFRLLQLGSAFWQSRILYVAAQLDIATTLRDDSLSSDEIAARVHADADAVYRLLRALTAMGIFEETAPRCFTNNELSSHLRTDHRHNVRAMILMHNSEVMSRPWYEQLEGAVRTGEVPFTQAHGEDLFGYMDSHPEFNELFSRAMDSVEAIVGDSYATDFDWGRFDRLVDVGGSRGGKALEILKRYPHMKAVVMDRGNVVENAEGYWKQRIDAALLARIRFLAGDVTQTIPPAINNKDVYFLSAVLHGFGDDDAVQVLRNLSHAIGDSGARVVLFEVVMPEAGADLASSMMDMQMLMGTRGRERTQREWQALFERGGLRLQEMVNLRTFAKLMVLRVG